MKSLRKQGIIIFIAFALVLSACGGDAAEEEVVVEETTPEVVETLDSPAVTTAQTVKTGVGVTGNLVQMHMQLLEHKFLQVLTQKKDVFI